MAPWPKASQRGVALLELLIGLTLLALIMLTLTQSQFIVLGAWRNMEKDRRQGQALARAQRVLQTQIASAVPFRPPRAFRRVPVFWGSSRRLTFVTCQPPRPGIPPGLWLVTYTLVPSDQGGEYLLMSQTRSALDPGYWQGRPTPVEGVTLLAGIRDLKFSYLSWNWRRKQVDASDTWQTTGSGRLPLAVRLELDLGGQRLSWYLPLACGKR